MNNYFPSFRLLTHFGVNKIQATGVFNKNSLRKCTIIGDKLLQKEKSVATFNSSNKTKKEGNFDSGWLELPQGGLHSFFWIFWT